MASTSLRRHTIKEIPFPKLMNRELLDKWCSIPSFTKNNPARPEWRETPVIEADLSRFGYGALVFIKDESDAKSNPTKTIKDRAAWEIAKLYRDFARHIAACGLPLEKIPVPRFSVMTSGNAGTSLSCMFSKYGLPPPKLLVNSTSTAAKFATYSGMYAEIYTSGMKRKLSGKGINFLTDNESGTDITSIKYIEPNAIFYDWHVHESFNQSPDQIYLPFGSGRLFENYLTWQQRTMREEYTGPSDPRLRVPPQKVAAMSILAAEPRNRSNSIADKLTKNHNPFIALGKQDVETAHALYFSGSSTGKCHVLESRIIEAYEIMCSLGIDTEPSGSAGLALYLDKLEKGLVNPDKKCLIINTGKGI